MSFVAGFLLSIFIERKRKRDAKVAVARSIIHELDAIHAALAKYVRTDAQLVTMASEFKTGRINNRLLTMPTAAYDSALSSGVFRDFDLTIQRNLAVVYDIIKTANNLEIKFLEVATVATEATPAFVDSLMMWVTMVNNKEKELQTLISQRLDELRGLYHYAET